MKLLIAAALLALPQLALAHQSIYTSIDPKDCIEIISSEVVEDPPIDFYEADCPGLGGYQVKVEGGDLRYDLKLSYQGVELPELSQIGSFHDLGSDKIEWRYLRHPVSNKAELRALIFRIDAQDMQADGRFVTKSNLHVVRLSGHTSCTVAVISGGDDLNQQARRVADSIDQYRCLENAVN